MPDVTEQMSQPSYWSSKLGNPYTVLATQEQIDAVNNTILHNSATCMNDLAAWEEGTFNGAAYAKTLMDAAESDARYFYFYGGAYYYWDPIQQMGVPMSDWDEAYAMLYGPIIQNAYDSDATENMPIRFGICTTRTNILCFPSNERVLDDVNDPDFDCLYQTAVRVGEPMVIKGESDDGLYYHVFTSCTSGWVAASDIAVCANKMQWLAAWQFDPAQTLVVYDDKIITEESHYAPAASQKLLTMGTCLQLATPTEYGDGALKADINRSGYNCHVVWLPIRNDDGSYGRMLALIAEHCKVSEGFLPLTYANVAKVALNQLGDAYGWGGMLSSEDCSGYVRDVYKCFGLELARNTTWQEAQPVRKYSFAGLSDQERADAVRSLPLGSVLFFNGHEMIYLGADGDNLYVISSISNVMVNGARVRVRSGAINTLNTQRASGKTWLQDLTSANVPYLLSAVDPVVEDVTYTCKSGADAEWYKGTQSGLTFVFDRNSDGALTYDRFTGISVDGSPAIRDVDYTVLSGSAIVQLAPAYLESLEACVHSLIASFADGGDVAVGFVTKTQDAPEAIAYPVTVEPSDGGFVGVSTGSAAEGATVRVTVRPDEGFVLKGVGAQTPAGDSVELLAEDNKTYTFVMPGDNVVVSAAFEVEPSPSPNLSPSPPPRQRLPIAPTCSLLAGRIMCTTAR
ncbi:MAG: NlpC/P60 family protein [Coriobacteriales bacterium]|nr:NlpC/P60 family protein [Coriobacteriales bacterium]